MSDKVRQSVISRCQIWLVKLFGVILALTWVHKGFSQSLVKQDPQLYHSATAAADDLNTDCLEIDREAEKFLSLDPFGASTPSSRPTNRSPSLRRASERGTQ